MSLSIFVREHHEKIIQEFAVFAETLMPAGAAMSVVELRDHADELLTAIVADMECDQSADEESRKSRGLGLAQAMSSSGRLHADARISHGFSLDSILAEFRALRATVLKLYGMSGESDISEAGRFNEAIDEALTVSIQRFAARTASFRDQFIGILSHDLRTPLGAIMTGASLLAVPQDDPARRQRVASRILNSAQRMERMIADLLDLTQDKLGGSLPIARQRTDLQRVCEEVVHETRAAHREAVMQLETTGDLVGDWDADRLAQVVSNLLGNAIQHGAGTAITVTAADEGETVTLAVHNGGTPIPPDLLPFVFDALARGRGEEANAGHSIGLGLFIARAVATAHGGGIDVVSSASTGTTFTVRLPRRAAA